MARRLAAVLAITASLLLGGCGADYGVDQHGNTVKAEQIDRRALAGAQLLG